MTDPGQAPGDIVHALLYDARGEDREVDLLQDPPRRVRNDQLLWVDVAQRDADSLRAVGAACGLADSTVELLSEPRVRSLLRRHDRYLHVGLRSAQPGEGGALDIVGLDLITAPNVVITVRDGPVEAFDRFRAEIEAATRVGDLDAATFTAALVDAILAGYLRLVEDLERRVDVLDERALRDRTPTAVLDELARLRRHVAHLRRALAPHREAFAALAYPEFAVHERLGRPWPGLLDRLDTTLAAVEAARELLLGTHDLVMTRLAQRTNDTVKVLTIISAVLLPASLIAGIMGMNFQLPWFDDPGNFWIAVGAMAGLMLATIGIALALERG